MKESARLFIVPTPIGNLEDFTFRAVRILKQVDLILAEDTRNTGKLLAHYNIPTGMQSYHAFNEHKIVDKVLARLAGGERIALVTDAGTPGISDPGFLLIRRCIQNKISLECLPGPTAFVPALIKSGLSIDSFTFEGFLPHKKGRKKRLDKLKDESRTMVFFESPHRLLKTLNEFIETFGESRQASVSREISKKFEETVHGNLAEICAHYSSNSIKGEIVIVVEGKK